MNDTELHDFMEARNGIDNDSDDDDDEQFITPNEVSLMRLS